MPESTGERVALIILDGFGLSAFEKGNAVFGAKLPYLQSLLKAYPATTISASGTDVGLDWGEVGNSEVGHFNIGAGRVVLQDLPRINASIESKRFFENGALLEAARALKASKKRLHIYGIASSGGVHGHIDHIKAMLTFAKQQKITDVVVHAITDGRDTQPKVAVGFIKDLLEFMKTAGVGKLGTIIGRYYAMDRDKRWDRIEKAFEAMVDRKGVTMTDPLKAIEEAYKDKQSDENLEPLIDPNVPGIQDGDLVICTNFRADRARQMMEALTDPKFSAFKRSSNLTKLEFVSFTSYGEEATSRVKVAFFAEPMPNYLADEIAQAKRYQLHVAETEKYAHVTYFLNAGKETALRGEERVLVPSPKVATYDETPEMSAKTVANEFMKRFTEKFSFGVVNFANPDMVGHTGNAKATIEAIEAVDGYLEKMVTTLLKDNVSVIVTADHGNCEQMIHPKTGEIDKEHTVNPVPFILARPTAGEARDTSLETLATQQPVGVLADVAPTVLDMLGIPIPAEMTGQSLANAI